MSIRGKVSDDGKLTEDVKFEDKTSGVTATVPAGTAVDADKLVLTITKAGVSSNVTLDNSVAYDVKIEGVAEGNTGVILIYMPKMMPAGMTAIQMFHEGQVMQREFNVADIGADEFIYDKTTGDVTFGMTHFSNVSVGATTTVRVNGVEHTGVQVELNQYASLTDGSVVRFNNGVAEVLAPSDDGAWIEGNYNLIIPNDGLTYILSFDNGDGKNRNELKVSGTWHESYNLNPGDSNDATKQYYKQGIIIEDGAKVILHNINIRTNNVTDAIRIGYELDELNYMNANGIKYFRGNNTKTQIMIADGSYNCLVGKSGIGFGYYTGADVYLEGNSCLYAAAIRNACPAIGTAEKTDGGATNYAPSGPKVTINVGWMVAIPMPGAAGIGGGFLMNSHWSGMSKITINGGAMQVYAGADATAIGTGKLGNCGEIVINGGKIYLYTNPANTARNTMGIGPYGGSCKGIYVSKDADIYYGTAMSWDKCYADTKVNGFEPMSSMIATGDELYQTGTNIDVTGVTLTYKDGTTKVLDPSEYTISSVDMSTGGKKTAVITYWENGNTITVNYTFSVADAFNALVASVKKTTYNLNYQFTAADFNVSAVGSDGSAGRISGYSISADTSTRGQKTITISYTDERTGKVLTTTCTVDIINTTLLNINYNEYDGNYHRLWWFGPGNYDVSGWKAYPDILNAIPTNVTGGNGEKISGLQNHWELIQRRHEDAPNKNSGDGVTGLEFYSSNNWYGVTVDDAVPYTTLGINCVVGYDAPVLGFGYYINGDVSTLKYNAPATYHDGEAGYENYGNYGAAHALTQFSCASFEAGKTYTVTWVVVFDDGIQKLSDWTINMKAADANNAVYVDTDKPNINVVVIAGQSNACGASPITQTLLNHYGNVNYPNVYIQYKNVYVENNTVYTASSNQSFEKYQFGIGGFQKEHFGIELGLANYLAGVEETKGEQWYIIKYAPTGSTLGTQWNDNNLSIDGKNMSLTTAMLEYVQKCISELDKDYDVQIRSFLWMQGEGDTGVEWLANAYAANEKNLVTKFRTTFAKYATRTVSSVPGSGIAFINAAIAANPEQKIVEEGGPNDWKYSTIVNTAKKNNSQYWFVPVEAQAELGSLLVGYKVGSHENELSTDYIVNSIYVDTSSLISKLDAWWEHDEYVVASDKTDWAHYSSQSMLDLGLWFGAGVGYMMTLDKSVGSGSVSNNTVAHTITYNANGGTVSPGKVVVAENCTITLHYPTRVGYTFKGWYTAANGGTKVGDAGASYTPSKDITLYAQWQVNSYNVNYTTELANNQTPTVTVNNTSVSNGRFTSVEYNKQVTVKVTGVSNNTTRNITIKDASGNVLKSGTVTNKNTTTLTFTMPAGDVIIVIS